MITTRTYTITELTPYINWAYFFHAWQFPAKYAAVASLHQCEGCRQAWIGQFGGDDRLQARAAMTLFDEAMEMLGELAGNGVVAKARFDLLPCRSEGEDLVFEGRWRLPCLRSQNEGGTCLCLTDFVLPQGRDGGDGINDRVGLFATCVDCPRPGDMLQQTLCDRLAEAAAEYLHLAIRKADWGYAPEENLSLHDLHAEKFQGIRPAVGYPCLPDQRIIRIIAHHLRFSEMGIALTETGAMLPHAATCGLLFAHPAARYFSVGDIDAAQKEDYEKRLSECLAQICH